MLTRSSSPGLLGLESLGRASSKPRAMGTPPWLSETLCPVAAGPGCGPILPLLAQPYLEQKACSVLHIYPYPKNLCTRFGVLTCLQAALLVVAWCLRYQGCGNAEPLSESLQVPLRNAQLVPGPTTESAPRARMVFRTGESCPDQPGRSICCQHSLLLH